MKAYKIEELIKLYNLKLVQDVKWKGFEVYGLNTGKQTLAVVFKANRIEILSMTPNKNFIRIFRSEENRVEGYMDFKIIIEYLVDGDEYRFIMKEFIRNKRS